MRSKIGSLVTTLSVAALGSSACGSSTALKAGEAAESSRADACREPATWMVNPDFATQEPAMTPEASVRELTAGSVKIEAAEESARTAVLRVSDGSGRPGTYEVEKAPAGWIVVAGRGCGAQDGAPKSPDDDCPMPESLAAAVETDSAVGYICPG